MSTAPGEDSPATRSMAGPPHLRLDNSALSLGEVAVRVLAWLGEGSG